MQTGKTHIDPYDLVLTGIRIVNACTEAIWVCSYRRVNLDPRERMSFQDWCKKIKHYLTAGEAFKEEAVDYSPQEIFNMLPSFWHGMEPADRKVIMTIMQSHGFRYTADSLKQLHTECSLPFSQLTDIRVCIIIARQHPGTLDMSVCHKKSAETTLAEVAEAQEAAAKQEAGLDDFQLVPRDCDGKPKLTGVLLLDHMSRVRNMRAVQAGKVRVEPSESINLEMQKDSIEMIQPTSEELRHGNILRYHFGEGAKRKCAQRKLNSLGSVIGTSTVVNSEENMAKMREALEFAAACADINRLEAKDKEEENKKKSKRNWRRIQHTASTN